MQTLKVIKIGGNIIDNEQALDAFIEAFSKIEGQRFWCMEAANSQQN